MKHPHRRLRTAVTAALALAALAGCAESGGTTTAGGPTVQSAASTAVPRSIAAVMHQPKYAHSRWGLAVRDLDTGRTLINLNARQFFPPGSTTKVFTGIATWDALKPDHRFVTPVYATGPVQGHTLTGSLVLVAQGDLVFGGRYRRDGSVDYRNFDHMEANLLPGMARLTPGNPLRAINRLADQIAASGVTRVRGNVVIDDRLWAPHQELSGIPLDPMMINENVIDLSFTGHTAGKPARFSYRPAISTQKVVSKVTTSKAGDEPDVTITRDAAGNLVATGTVPANGKPIVQTADIEHPSNFARVALIDALARRGVTVTARKAGPNPVRLLPPTQDYTGDQRLARFVSPQWREYEKLILKVSHNKGADTNMCLLARTQHQRQCAAGLPMVRQYLTTHGVPGGSFTFADGRGGEPGDLTTPNAALAVLKTIASRPDARRFKRSLPILGRNGSIADDEKNSPAAGHVFAKTGSVAAGDVAGQRIVLIAETLIGYIDTASGRHLEFALYVNNLTLQRVSDLIGVIGDEDRIAALLYERY